VNRAWHNTLLRKLRFVALAIVLLAGFSESDCSAAEKTYIIQRGDTLYGIAKKHGVTANDLAEQNGLGKNPQIYAGRRLTIPSPKNSTATAPRKPATSASPGLPESIQSAISKAPVRSGRWKHIVIHHSGVNIGSPKGMDRYHREERKMENGLAYHFVIGNGNGMRDGEISVGRRWTQQLDGGHLASTAQNRVAIGICLVGNFDSRGPTAKQMQSLRLLTKSLMSRCRLQTSAVKTHQEINVKGTRCPGAKFNAKAFRDSL
jgi:hypothetical protein